MHVVGPRLTTPIYVPFKLQKNWKLGPMPKAPPLKSWDLHFLVIKCHRRTYDDTIGPKYHCQTFSYFITFSNILLNASLLDLSWKTRGFKRWCFYHPPKLVYHSLFFKSSVCLLKWNVWPREVAWFESVKSFLEIFDSSVFSGVPYHQLLKTIISKILQEPEKFYW